MLTSDHHHLLPPPSLVIAGPRKYRTLCDLPVELLCIIVSNLPDDILLPSTILACTLACRCIRPLALTRHFREDLFLHGLTSFEHGLSFLQANPKICERITRLKLQGEIREIGRYRYSATTPLDDATLARILQLLPKVEHLELWFFIYLPPAPASPSAPSPHTVLPRRLKSCHVQFGDWQKDECDSSVSGLFRIFSLFPSIWELRIRNAASKFGTSPPLDPAVLHRCAVRIRSISMREHRARDSDALGSTLKLVSAFRASTKPGLLEALEVGCSSAEEVAAAGELIAHAGDGLKTLDVGAEARRELRADWEDPLDGACRVQNGAATMWRRSRLNVQHHPALIPIRIRLALGHWEKLNLASCSKLTSIEVHVHFRPDSGEADIPQPKPQLKDEDKIKGKGKGKEDEDVPQRDEDVPHLRGNRDVRVRSLTVIGMLSQVSKTVREITIRLHGLPHAQATLQLLQKKQLLGLEALDEAITRDRFQCLRSMHLRMHFRSTYRPMLNTDWQKIESAVRSHTLPNLEGQAWLFHLEL